VSSVRKIYCILNNSISTSGATGALKATSNRGLQPAMDHILENEAKPVPDLSAAASSSGAPSTAAEADEDEDAEAARAVYGAGGSGSVDSQAKVRLLLLLYTHRPPCCFPEEIF
jgi:UBX domain-containing protein 1/4